MPLLRFFLYCLFFCLSSFFSTLIFSQATNDLEEETILVTASRIPIPASSVGSAYTVIEREEIEKRQLTYLTDILRDIPGFSVSQSGSFGSQTQIRIRGAEANQVAVFIDGVKANDPAAGDELVVGDGHGGAASLQDAEGEAERDHVRRSSGQWQHDDNR